MISSLLVDTSNTGTTLDMSESVRKVVPGSSSSQAMVDTLKTILATQKKDLLGV